MSLLVKQQVVEQGPNLQLVVAVVVVVVTVVTFLDKPMCHETSQQQHLDQQIPILHEAVGFVIDCGLKCSVRALAVVLEAVVPEEQQVPILQSVPDCASGCGPEEAWEHLALEGCLPPVLVVVLVVQEAHRHRHFSWKYLAEEC